MKIIRKNLRLVPVIGLSLAVMVTSCSKGTAPAPEQSTPLTTDERLSRPADPENGRRLFMACAICHEATAGQRHRVGPNLWGIYDKPAAGHSDFAYSKALRDSNIIWDEQSLDAYIENPRSFVPRGRMSYAGEADAANRRDIIAYLRQQQ